ncbi:LIM and calponin homology domains-containing protein 1 isoform X3 [Onychostoma macrolepis]|uniref:LIM and calponin homology domains-containing protein 1 isoform X3 n=1 Tax=Onychostoma macrolepis TaxID=369639 RepID=UPI00272BB4B7|nr:LIM and calponin homology domains-containing protein 1 isoform X3 [Onychostoma macrolepis]
MASSGSDAGRHLLQQAHHHHPEPAPEAAVREAQRWIEITVAIRSSPYPDQMVVTGRSFTDSDFRGGLDNGILLCELLNTIRPGLVKKINRLPTPVAALDNVALFLKGCLELGLKSSQLFDPGDLQDTSARSNKGPDNNKKLKNVLINIYWLGRAANSSTTYNGPTLDLHKFEGLLSQMRKEAEEWDSPKRSIRDSGYIDCWESERSDSLSPPRHMRNDSFDSLDSIGSRSHQTPSPDGLLAHGYSDGRGSDSECDTPQRKMPDVRKDDMLVRRTSCSEPRTAIPFNQYLPNKSNQSSYLPAPVRRPRAERDDSRKSWSNVTSPVGGERPFRFSRSSSVFDDPESVSMIDMRSEEDSMLPRHSQVRHELMHNQYNKLKEEEDHWQDDLAKWKSRRRSVSQDLIKKEEERKMMERLLDGDGGSQRRKSIKTYREIVEEKERREQELHEAYWNARTPEEAASVLQRYAQRFTISEAIIERLKLPKLLERSVSADPTRHSSLPVSQDIPFSLSASSNPLQYLRQQSLPLAKFTSTVEARVTGYSTEHEFVGDVTAPSLGPKPYSSATAEMRTAKVDEIMRVNGEREDGGHSNEKGGPQKHKEAEDDSLQFFPSSYQHTDSDITDTDVSGVQPMDHTLSSMCTQEWCEKDRDTTEVEGGTVPQVGDVAISPEVLELKAEKTDQEQTDETYMSDSQQDMIQFNNSAVQVNKLATEIPQKSTNQSESSNLESYGTKPDMAEKDGNVPPPVLNLVKRSEHFSWDPEEERKRQERWQQEQERMLQEKYQCEQEKLKQEWEQAQKEVEEEERRYHEEERKILEETLTPHSMIAPSIFPKTHSTLQSQPEPENKPGSEEKQMSSGTYRQGENGNSEAAQRKTESVQMTVSSPLQGCGSVSQRRQGDQSQEKQPTLPSSQDMPLGNRQIPQPGNETWKKNASQPKSAGRRRYTTTSITKQVQHSFSDVRSQLKIQMIQCYHSFPVSTHHKTELIVCQWEETVFKLWSSTWQRCCHDYRDSQPLLSHPVF